MTFFHLNIISIDRDFGVVRDLITKNHSVEHESFWSEFVEEVVTFKSVEKCDYDVDAGDDEYVETSVEELGFGVG